MDGAERRTLGARARALRPTEPLEPDVLRAPLATRTGEMLRRFEAGDMLGALVISESILQGAPAMGLAVVCHDEAVAVLQSLLRWTPPKSDPIAGADPDALALLARFDGQMPIVAHLPRGGCERTEALRALHALACLGVFDTVLR